MRGGVQGEYGLDTGGSESNRATRGTCGPGVGLNVMLGGMPTLVFAPGERM